jgi:hypothetical protein
VSLENPEGLKMAKDMVSRVDEINAKEGPLSMEDLNILIRYVRKNRILVREDQEYDQFVKMAKVISKM